MGRPRKTLDPEKTAIWIDGVEELECIIERAQGRIDSEIYEIERKIRGYRYKDVKGKKYLYRWEDGKHIYVGKTDPRPTLEKNITKLKHERKELRKTMRSCVIKEIDGHLIVDLEEGFRFDDLIRIIKISKILELK